MKNSPSTFDYYSLDVTDTEAIFNVIQTAFEKHTTIDVIVNNTEYGLFGAAEELSYQEIELIIATNLTGIIQVIRAAIPFLRKQQHGRLISQALNMTISVIEKRLEDFKGQMDLAASTDIIEE